jgi:SET domain-containing protein
MARAKGGARAKGDEVVARGEGVEVRQAGRKGRGVFAARPFKKGETVELCPAIVVKRSRVRVPAGLDEYHFLCEGGYLIALGFGSLYNHAEAPSCWAELDADARTMRVEALRDIAAGEELTIDYRGEPEDGQAREGEVWFRVLD